MRKDSCGLKALPDPSPTLAGPVSCDLAAYGSAGLTVASLAELRRRPGPVFGDNLPTGFLKHVDEQSAAGLAAVYRAITEAGLDPAAFRDWTVLAAPVYLGQAAMAASWMRFREEGAWGVSPHVIPHRSLHSPSGTISHALKIHGANLGVGGCRASAADALLAASAVLARGRVPGVWLVLTTMRPDGPLTPEGGYAPESESVGLAMALCPERSSHAGLRLRVRVRPEDSACVPGSVAPPPDLFRLRAAIDHCRREGRGGPPRVVSESAPRVDVGWATPSAAVHAPAVGLPRPVGAVTGAEAER